MVHPTLGRAKEFKRKAAWMGKFGNAYAATFGEAFVSLLEEGMRMASFKTPQATPF
jgi:hypothetical protein